MVHVMGASFGSIFDGAFVHLGVRLSTQTQSSAQQINTLTATRVAIFAVDGVLASGRALCSGVSLLVGMCSTLALFILARGRERGSCRNTLCRAVRRDIRFRDVEVAKCCGGCALDFGICCEQGIRIVVLSFGGSLSAANCAS